jgi:hypothetical protein
MAESGFEFERFFNRDGFNRSLSHFQTVSSLLEDFEAGENLADMLNELFSDKEIQQEQVAPILSALLVDKYRYRCRSMNLDESIDDFAHIKTECPGWNAVDLVVAYQHPDLGITLVNPKNPAHWDDVSGIRKTELVTVYAGGNGADIAAKVTDKAIETLFRFLQGRKTKSPATLLEGDLVYEPPVGDSEEAGSSFSAPESDSRLRRESREREAIRFGDSGDSTAVSDDSSVETSAAGPRESALPSTSKEPAVSGGRRMTPMYSVPVTNELFHNGNVEAWKKIIQSYQVKFPEAEVLLFYEGERIHDINTLFKWGKVKHGSTILFAVVGEGITDVAKLQRYFRQGASPQFEAFLRAPVNTVLKLF